MNLPDQQPLGKEPQKVPINVDTIKLLWSQTYNREGKPDWSHIFPYYHKDIVFQDTIQRIEGIDDFIAMCSRLTKRTTQLKISLAILFITGIPLKIVSMFAKHVLVAILALMAIINFEIITPKFQKIAASGPSPELEKKQTEL